MVSRYRQFLSHLRHLYKFLQKQGTSKTRGITPLTVGFPCELWCIDLAGDYVKTFTGYKYIFTALDSFSKFIVLVPLRDKKAITVATAFWNHVFIKFGIGTILTDRGLEFQNNLLNELCRL